MKTNSYKSIHCGDCFYYGCKFEYYKALKQNPNLTEAEWKDENEDKLNEIYEKAKDKILRKFDVTIEELESRIAGLEKRRRDLRHHSSLEYRC